jgi:hypothetical protein
MKKAELGTISYSGQLYDTEGIGGPTERLRFFSNPLNLGDASGQLKAKGYGDTNLIQCAQLGFGYSFQFKSVRLLLSALDIDDAHALIRGCLELSKACSVFVRAPIHSMMTVQNARRVLSKKTVVDSPHFPSLVSRMEESIAEDDAVIQYDKIYCDATLQSGDAIQATLDLGRIFTPKKPFLVKLICDGIWTKPR